MHPGDRLAQPGQRGAEAKLVESDRVQPTGEPGQVVDDPGQVAGQAGGVLAGVLGVLARIEDLAADQQ